MQPFGHVLGGRGIQIGERFLRHPQLEHGGTCPVGIGAVVDGLVYVDDVHRREARRRQQVGRDVGVGQGEGVDGRCGRRRWRLPGGERRLDRDMPLLVLGGLPDQLHQARARTEGPPDVGERGAGVGEEHRAEPAGGEREVLRREGMGLGVGLHEADIAEPVRLGLPAGPRQHRTRDVDAERGPRRGGSGGVPGGLPGAAADVEDTVTGPDVEGRPQPPVVAGEF